VDITKKSFGNFSFLAEGFENTKIFAKKWAKTKICVKTFGKSKTFMKQNLAKENTAAKVFTNICKKMPEKLPNCFGPYSLIKNLLGIPIH
jgi:hypothetical protein